MCVLCQRFQPWEDSCFYSDLDSWPSAEGTNDDGDGEAGSLPTFTYDQIADQLTTGYWGGGSSRSFDASAGDTLYVDITALATNGQDMAREALDAFDEVGGPVVVITGNGHARKDWGVPSYLAQVRPELRVVSLGQSEDGTLPEGGFDMIIDAPSVERDDPCAAFE